MLQHFLLTTYVTALLTSMAGMEIFGWLIAAVAFGLWLYSDRISFRVGADLWLWGYLLVCILSLVFSPIDGATMADAGKLRWVPLLYALTYFWSKLERRTVEKVVKWYFVVAVIAALYSVEQFFFGIELFRSREVVRYLNGVYRATGFFHMSLTFAYVIGIAGFVAAGRLWTLPVKQMFYKTNGLWLAGAVAGVVGCVTSLTRGSWIALVGTAFIILFMVAPKRLLSLSVAVMVMLGLGLSFNSYLKTRIASIVDLNESTNQHRLIIWQSQWEIVKAHPWLGVGYTDSGLVAPDYLERARGFTPTDVDAFYQRVGIGRDDFKTHAHNNFLYTWAGSGIFALICYLMFSWYFLRLAWTSYRRFASGGDALFASLALGIFGSQIFFHIGGLTECNFFDGEVNHNLIFIWSMLASLFRNEAQKKKALPVISK